MLDDRVEDGPRRQRAPGVVEVRDFRAAGRLAPGVLDIKTKELIALAVAVTRECDGCITAHADAAARSGATEAEVAEMLGVVILMNGGPGTTLGPGAFAAFRDAAERLPAAARG